MSRPTSDADGARTIRSRKADHIDLCIDGDVAFHSGTLLNEVGLIHDALPELCIDDIDLSTTLLGRTLRAPLVISAMTGGTPRATTINRDLARVAHEAGIGFAFGSQRPLLAHGIRDGYDVRDVAPDILLLGNIGVVQARDTSSAALRELVASTGVDALVLHLNPAMELIQPRGDRDFRGCLETIRRLVGDLPVPIVVKETGCGLSRSVGERIVAAGVRHVDTSGAGGTSWVAVETQRADPAQRALGERFWDWGIPTAASIAQLDGLGLTIIATGGLSTGLDAARAIALGATAAGVARPFLQAQAQGLDALRAAVQTLIDELTTTILLTGSGTPRGLGAQPLILGPSLARWVPKGGPLATRAGL